MRSRVAKWVRMTDALASPSPGGVADAKMAHMDLMPPFLSVNPDMLKESHDMAAVATMYLSMGFAAALLLGFALLGFALYLLFRWKS